MFSFCQEPHRRCTLQNLHGSTWVWLSTFAKGNNFHAFASRPSSCRKSSKTILTFRPPLPTPKVEQTSNQSQEHWLNPKLFSSSLVKPRNAHNWMTGRSRTVINQRVSPCCDKQQFRMHISGTGIEASVLITSSLNLFLLLHGGQKKLSIN